MTGTSYVPGTWLGIVRSHTAVILGPDTPPALADSVWNLIAGKTEVYEVLQAITGSAGGNLSRIPPFAILDFTGPLRVFLRGGLELSVETPAGPAELNGRDVTTWSERSFAVPGACTLMIPGAGDTGQPELRLGEGMVLLQAIRLGADAGQGALEAPDAARAATVLAPEAAEESAPETAADTAAESAADIAVAAVAVDSTGTAEVVPEAASASDSVAGQAADPGAPDAGDVALPERAIAPGQAEVSVETVYAVLDEDGEYADHGGAQQAGTGEAGSVDNDPAANGSVEDGAADKASGETGSPDAEATGLDMDGDADRDAESAVPGAADLPAAIDLTSSYDHLWERTVMRNIEDAAVREEPAEDDHESAPAIEAAAPQAAIEADADAAEQQVPEHPLPHDEADGAGLPPVAAPKPAAGLLIESVPWRTGGAGNVQAPAPEPFTPAPASTGAPPAAPPAFGAPKPESQPGTAQPASYPAAPGAGPSATGFDDDHDGQTVMKSSVSTAQQAPATSGVPGTDGSAPASGPLVLARVCPQGHANPPIRSACTECGASLPQDAVQVGRPRLGRMRLSTGELLDLDQSLVIGRQPSVSRVQGGGMPRLVQVPSPGGDISRSHVEVRLEGWHVMLCDVKATNGTVLVRQGQPPRRLAQNEMAILLDGDIAELGDNISLRFEEIP
ncbi:FHA domain-containing protein [Pseudarthrobacter sp. 1G09]|uniref:FHA domain-containing protein n=1 Tax=Pseudarthrobacter sp. 1G09 TaxID=3416178 RepID=UPI003CF09346